MEFGDTQIEARLPAQTEEWAEDVIEGLDMGFECERTDEALIVRRTVGGNCNAVVLLGGLASDLSDAFQEGNIDPAEVTVTVRRAA